MQRRFRKIERRKDLLKRRFILSKRCSCKSLLLNIELFQPLFNLGCLFIVFFCHGSVA